LREKRKTTCVFEEALKQNIAKGTFVSFKVMEKGKFSPTLGQCRSAESQQKSRH
jgi:hypothetical protein